MTLENKDYGSMKIKQLFGFIIVTCFLSQCQTSTGNLKSELIKVEKEFCERAQSQGIQNAFYYFAADSAVILRGNRLVKGKLAIKTFYESLPKTGIKLEWEPDFEDVSVSGELGYTYGKYSYTSTDSLGHSVQSKGVFHTVWKRQHNGEWRFVWD